MAGMALLLFSSIHGNYIWYTDCCKVSMSYVMQTPAIFFWIPKRMFHKKQYMPKEILWPGFSFCRPANHIASNNTANYSCPSCTSNKSQLGFVFFFWMNIFQINNYHWTHINYNEKKLDIIGYKPRDWMAFFKILSEIFCHRPMLIYFCTWLKINGLQWYSG